MKGNTIPFKRYKRSNWRINRLDTKRIISKIDIFEKFKSEEKEDVIRIIEEQGKLTEEIKSSILKM